MKTYPLVSIIIPYYNSGCTIKETVNSILNQSYPNYDIWIVNDGSTEMESIDILQELDKIKQINVLHQDNSGPSVARNLAIMQTNAEFIFPLDADDLIYENAIEEAINKIISNPEIGVVYGNVNYLFTSPMNTNYQIFKDLNTQLIYNQLVVSALIRKDVFKQVGLYDEFLSKLGLEDWEFWIRVFDSGWQFNRLDIPFLTVRISKNSRTHLQANNNIDLISEYVYKKHIHIVKESYKDLFYKKKQLLETPDYKIGNFLLKPYRLIKSIFNR